MNYEFVISVTAARTLSVWFKAFWQSHTREMAAPTVALPKQCGAKTCAWVYRIVLVVGVWSKACIVSAQVLSRCAVQSSTGSMVSGLPCVAGLTSLKLFFVDFLGSVGFRREIEETICNENKQRHER